MTGSPAVIQVGDSAVIQWETSYALDVSLDNGIGPVPVSGTIEVSPTTTTTYTLTASNILETSSTKVTITVSPLAFRFIEPDGLNEVADTDYTIQWTDSAPVQSSATISLYYDVDNSGADGILIAENIPVAPDGSSDEYNWNISTLTSGSYYLYAVIEDGINPPITEYSPKQVIVYHPWANESKLLGSKLEQYTHFGAAVDIKGDLAAVGTSEVHASGVTIYRRVNNAWQQETVLSLDNHPNKDYFGRSVAVSNDVIVVGAPGAAAVYVFRHNGVQWEQEAQLGPENGSESNEYGVSIAVDGDVIIVGAPGQEGFPPYLTGSAYFYRYNGSTWIQEEKLTCDDSCSEPFEFNFGRSVAIDGSKVILGSAQKFFWGYSAVESGAAYLYEFEGSSWIRIKRLASVPAFGPGGDVYDDYGKSVAISGENIMVGAPGNDTVPGLAYTYVYNGTSWKTQNQIMSPNSTPGDRFGESVSLDGNYGVVGAAGENNNTGAAYIFHGNEAEWQQEIALTAANLQHDDHFGISVAISENQVLIGAPDDNDLDWLAGAAYMYAVPAIHLNSDTTAIQAGAPVTLSWQSVNADTIVLNNSIGQVPQNDTLTVYPNETTTYTIAASNLLGTSSAEVTVTVNHSTEIEYFTANPTEIASGGLAILSWSVSNADTVSIDNGIGNVPAQGSRAVYPENNTTYTITANSSLGSNSAEVTVTVNQQAGIEYFSADPDVIVSGGLTTLSWSIANADTVSIDNGIGNVPTQGSRAIYPESNTTYTITASGPLGISSAEVTVTVNHPPGIEDFSVDPAEIASGELATLTWSVSNADTVSIDNGIGNVPAQGSKVVYPENNTTYTITASNPLGISSAEVTVTVNPLPEIEYFTVNPDEIASGGLVILSWSVSNADTVSIDNGIGDVSAQDSRIVYPESNTAYTITVTGPGCLISAQVPVIIHSLPFVTLTTNSNLLQSGEQATISWSSENSDHCLLEPFMLVVDCTGSLEVSPD